MSEIVALKAVIVPVWFLLFFIGERIARVSNPPRSKARLWRNGGLWAINLAISPLIVLPLTIWAAGHSLWMRPTWFSSPISLGVDLLILDFWIYWLHRTYHEVPLMWRLHKLHHRDQHLDTSSAVRFHFGEVALSAVFRTAPILVLAIPFSSVVVFEIVLLCGAIFHHSNLRLPVRFERALSAIVITPSIHWIHHHATKADTNSNYGAVFSVWDRLFHSRSATQRTPDMKIGVEGVEDDGLLRLLLSPIRR